MIDRDRLVDLALRLVSTPSFTGSEEEAAELMRSELASLGLQVQWQQVEDGRANVLGTWPGEGGGPTLMLNGHLDTSYSGREPRLPPGVGRVEMAVQHQRRPSRHVLLRAGAVARGHSGVPAAGIR